MDDDLVEFHDAGGGIADRLGQRPRLPAPGRIDQQDLDPGGVARIDRRGHPVPLASVVVRRPRGAGEGGAKAAPGDQRLGLGDIVHRERDGPYALAVTFEMATYRIAERALAGRRDHVQGHILQLKPGVPSPAVPTDPVRLPPEQRPVACCRLIQVPDREGDVVEAGDHGVSYPKSVAKRRFSRRFQPSR